MSASLENLRFGDIFSFLTVVRTGSMSAAARDLRVTPSQVSKAIVRLEGQLGIALLVRSSRGASLGDNAQRVASSLQAVVGDLRSLTRADTEEKYVRVAAPSYLIGGFVPQLASAYPTARVRALELPPSLIRALSAQGIFDLALSPALSNLPPSWETIVVGELRKGLFATPQTARTLGRRTTESRIATLPFVTPVFQLHGQFVPSDDDCPLRVGHRREGHQVQTFPLALEIAARTHQLAYGPVFAASAYVARGELVELSVDGWAERSEPLYLTCNIDQVPASLRAVAVNMMKQQLSMGAGPAGDESPPAETEAESVERPPTRARTRGKRAR